MNIQTFINKFIEAPNLEISSQEQEFLLDLFNIKRPKGFIILKRKYSSDFISQIKTKLIQINSNESNKFTELLQYINSINASIDYEEVFI